MKKLAATIKKVVLQSPKVDWLIVHAIGKEIQDSKSYSFSFIDGKERFDNPFKTNQGYISLKNAPAVKSFAKLIQIFTSELKGNLVALSNFFIVISRMSYTKEDSDILIDGFRKQVGNDVHAIFNNLINSLNTEYFKHHRSEVSTPKDTEQWLLLLSQSQYYHGISNPIMSVLQLVRQDHNAKIKFSFITGMAPILRSFVFGCYGFEIVITKAEMNAIINDNNELTFLSALLVDAGQTDKINWLSKNLFKELIENHWDRIGRHLFKHIFGLGHRNNNENPTYRRMERFLHTILLEKLKSETEASNAWISQLSFPESFIALFNWIAVKKVKFTSIAQKNRQLILNQFIVELDKIAKESPQAMCSENREDPFKSFQLHEPKYQYALAYILLLFLYATPENLKSLSKICYRYKPLFFGGYKATRLASDFAEILMLIVLSGYKIHGVGDDEYNNLVKLLAILEQTILTPYIHISEREEEIWNPENEKGIMSYNAGKHLINESLFNIKNHPVTKHYEQFFQLLERVKIAEWPYERMKF